MKVYFRFDKNSVPEKLMKSIITNNKLLTLLDNELFSFKFEPLEFLHAWQLLGNSSTRYGNDLSQYIPSVCDFFNKKRVNQNELLSLNFGTTDFKKRMSEDLAVSIASLFMVNSFGIKWENITQIPENNKISKFRPDFEGFNSLGERYLYESKGRSNLQNLISAMDKAVQQVKDYPESALHKLAFITYLSSDERAFASHTFLLDPQMPDIIPPDKDTSKKLHLIKVLEFAGFTESKKAYLTLFREQLAQKKLETISKGREGKLSNVNEKFIQTFKAEVEKAESIEYKGMKFLGRALNIKTKHGNFKFTTGIHEKVINTESNISIENKLDLDSQEQTSLFTDGTLLKVLTPF